MVVDMTNPQFTLMRIVLLLPAAASLSACSNPNSQVEGDVREFVARHLDRTVKVVVLSYGIGEGDTDHVYYEVNIALTSHSDRHIIRGPFAGLALRSNVTLSPVKLEMVYQYNYAKSAWVLIHERVTVTHP